AMRIVISVMVDSLAGAGDALERLLNLLSGYELKATFFISCGPDRNAPFLSRLRNAHHISLHADNLFAIAEQGHEIGLAPWDPVSWRQKAAVAHRQWLADQWSRGFESWRELFSEEPASHAATGFQAHPELFRLEQDSGIRYASDTRGKTPFYPLMQNQRSSCLQLPVTLPGAGEMPGGSTRPEVHQHEEIYDASLNRLPLGHHWRFVAGQDDPELLEKLIVMWRGSSGEFMTLDGLAQVATKLQPRQHIVGWETLTEGHSVAAQSIQEE
ncbi:MAG: hypothetical protein ABFR19_10355, partial [Pseudomonadota bacterium]